MPLTHSALQRSLAILRLMVLTLWTPVSVATRCSPDRGTMPTQQPSSHLSSKDPTRCFVFGILNITISAKGTILP